MRLIDLDEFLRQNCIDRMEGKSCEECRHHVLEVSCERLMEHPTAERVGKWIVVKNKWGGLEIICSECGAQVPRDEWGDAMWCNYCPHCGARMEGEEDERPDQQTSGD